MYVNPVILPQVTNREDLYLPVSLYDDDFGTPINISGIIAGNGGVTFSSWNVTDGSILTTSSTTFTIPALPLSNQLSALAITVGVGLAINAGDPITITDAGTGKNTIAGYVTSYVPSTGALVVQIGLTFQFEIRKLEHSGPLSYGFGYSSYPALGTYDDSTPEIVASLANYIDIVDNGYILITIPEAIMKTLRPGMRRASLTMTDSVSTRQVFVAQMPLVSGGVTS